MKLGIMQPYFLPYIGYFQLINAVDKYVIYDDVQYIKGGWINRNYILLNKERHLINLLLSGASPNKLINEVDVQSNQSKIIKTIECAYKKAPMFNEIYSLFLNMVEFENKNLGQFLKNSIIEICSYLGIKTEIIYSSLIEKDNSLRSKEKVIYICNLFGADTYINAIGGKTLYDKSDFKKCNIELQFLDPNIQKYAQFGNEFVSCLSIIDVLMFNSIEKVKKMLNEYCLV